MNLQAKPANEMLIIKIAILLISISSIMIFATSDIYYAQIFGIPGVILVLIAHYCSCNKKIFLHAKNGNNSQIKKEKRSS